MDKITATQILDARERIKQHYQAMEEARRQQNKEINHLKWEVYGEVIRQIENFRDRAIRELEERHVSLQADKAEEILPYSSIITQAERILAMLTLETEPITIGDDDVVTYGDAAESLGYLFDDDYLKIKLFIITNDRPKNKYSLIAVGRSIFGEPLIKYPRDCGLRIKDFNTGFKLEAILSFAASTDELKKWLAKHRGDLLGSTLKDYQQVKRQYIAVKQEYTREDFKELITWTCPQCKNFRTIFDYRPIPGTTPPCYRHNPYVDMIKTETSLEER